MALIEFLKWHDGPNIQRLPENKFRLVNRSELCRIWCAQRGKLCSQSLTNNLPSLVRQGKLIKIERNVFQFPSNPVTDIDYGAKDPQEKTFEPTVDSTISDLIENYETLSAQIKEYSQEREQTQQSIEVLRKKLTIIECYMLHLLRK